MSDLKFATGACAWQTKALIKQNNREYNWVFLKAQGLVLGTNYLYEKPNAVTTKFSWKNYMDNPRIDYFFSKRRELETPFCVLDAIT
jgi:hypothetical protein